LAPAPITNSLLKQETTHEPEQSHGSSYNGREAWQKWKIKWEQTLISMLNRSLCWSYWW